jgi:hypothetical protein
MWDVDGKFRFPIPKENIQMSLEGLDTPYSFGDQTEKEIHESLDGMDE